MLNTQGQMTCERILALLNDMGVVISKRQVARLLTSKLKIFRDEDEAVLKAGLVGDYVKVDDTGPVMPARTATPRRSARTAFVCFAAVRANRGWLSCRD